MAYFVTPLKCFPEASSGDVGDGTDYPFGFDSLDEAIKFQYVLHSIEKSQDMEFLGLMEFTFDSGIYGSLPTIYADLSDMAGANVVTTPVASSSLASEIAHVCDKPQFTAEISFSFGDTTSDTFAFELTASVGISVDVYYLLRLDDIVFYDGKFYPYFRFKANMYGVGSGEVKSGDTIIDANGVNCYHEWRTSLDSFDFATGSASSAGNISFLGHSIPLWFKSYNDESQLGLSTYNYSPGTLPEFSAAAKSWWPYDPGDGNGPVWDAATGAQLRAPVVRDSAGGWHEV